MTKIPYAGHPHPTVERRAPEDGRVSPTGNRRIASSDGDGVIIRHSKGGPLHDLLLRACPPDERNRKSITVLAEALDISAWSIHKWINRGKIPPKRAAEVTDLADGRVTLGDFSPFIYV